MPTSTSFPDLTSLKVKREYLCHLGGKTGLAMILPLGEFKGVAVIVNRG